MLLRAGADHVRKFFTSLDRQIAAVNPDNKMPPALTLFRRT
jgi:hypothetical protein